MIRAKERDGAKAVVRGIAVLLLGSALGMACGSDDDPIVLSAEMSGSQEVPPVTSIGSGFCKVKIADDGSQIRYELSVEDLSGVLFAHIHAGAIGQNGPVLFTLATTTFTEVEGDLTASDLSPTPGIQTFEAAIDAIEAGGTYCNVHTASSPGGEVRGQLE